MTQQTHDDLIDDERYDEEPPAAPPRRARDKMRSSAHRLRPRSSKLFVRRLIGIAFIAAVVAAVIWFVLYSPIGQNAFAQVRPVYHKAMAMINDPLGIDWGGQFMSIAVLLISHIGLYMMFFDDKR